jgi:hypothetical protein
MVALTAMQAQVHKLRPRSALVIAADLKPGQFKIPRLPPKRDPEVEALWQRIVALGQSVALGYGVFADAPALPGTFKIPRGPKSVAPTVQLKKNQVIDLALAEVRRSK